MMTSIGSACGTTATAGSGSGLTATGDGFVRESGACRPAKKATPATATTAAISLKEFAITGQLNVPAGDVTLNVKNDGSQVHNLFLKGGKGTKDINPGASDTLALGKLKAGDKIRFAAEQSGGAYVVTRIEPRN